MIFENQQQKLNPKIFLNPYPPRKLSFELWMDRSVNDFSSQVLLTFDIDTADH